jgi:DNA-binding MarR family transcriptional regulator
MAPKREDVEALITALHAVRNDLTRAERKIKNASLLRLLHTVAATEPVRPSELAAHLEVHQSLITRQIRELEDEGTVSVSADPQDGRAFVVAMTEVGRKRVAELAEVGLQRFIGFLRGWDTDEIREFTRLLRKFQETRAESGESNPPGWSESPAKPRRRGR